MRQLLLGFAVVLLPSSLLAAPFTFSGSDVGGTGSAFVDISVSGNTLTWTMDNTSPITLDNGTGVNAPGIVGFGFNLANMPTLLSWTLTAFTDAAQTTAAIIGDDSGIFDWKMGTFQNGVTLDFLPQIQNIKGAIYNPAAPAVALAAPPNYFSSAVLTMQFDGMPVLQTTSNSKNPSPFVRMKNVGNNGGGSLKLPGQSGNQGGPPVPEPASAALFALGVISLGAVRRRKTAIRPDESAL